MRLNLPIIEQLGGCKQVLLAGMGGGFDIFCGLPIYAELRQHGFQVHLANLSFADIVGLQHGNRLSPTLVGVHASMPWIIPATLDQAWFVDPEQGTVEALRQLKIYFPELYLARWLKQADDAEPMIWCFEKTGAQALLDNYRTLAAHLGIDAIILIDGGVDSLVRGDEHELGTVIEDSLSLLAVSELPEVPVRLLACLGFGAELHMSYGQIFENIAALTAQGAFLGCCALAPQMSAYQAYKAAVEFVHSQPFQDPSIINASVLSAVEGNFGDYHLTERTRGSRLWISPLMSIYWFFDLPGVARNNLLLPQLAATQTLGQAVRAVVELRKHLRPRPQRAVELP